MLYETATDRKARLLISRARATAPSFIMLNIVMSKILDCESSCPAERKALVNCARYILSKER